MKNFTNSFKQFTSRLSARWLIMALMMLVGTGSAWADRVYYVNINKWTSVYCYAWKDGGSNEAGWPGTSITSNKCDFKVNGYDVYYYDTNGTSDKCIFNNNSSQSSDLTIANGPYFYGNTARVSVKDIYDNDAWMFYINQDYNTSALCIHNGSSYISGTYVASKNYYISTSKSNINGKTINISNNCGSWTGTGGKTGGTTVGTTYVHPGCYYKTGNQGTSIVKAATLSSLSIASSISKTDASSVNVTAKATSSTSSYGNALKAQYFVDNIYVDESAQLSTSGTTTTLNLSSFSDGSHTLSVILTDGTISYPDAKTATFTIISCTNVETPNVTADAICAGSTATLTLTNRQDGVTYRLNSTTGNIIFSTEDTYTTPAALNANTTYTIYASHEDACDGANNVPGTVTVTVNAIPATPNVITSATVCPNTAIALSSYDNGVANVSWYTSQQCSQEVTSSISIDADKTYYARVKNGNCYSETESLTLSVYEAPAAPDLSPSGKINVGQNKSTTITVENMDANATYVCYKGNTPVGTWNGNSVTFNVGDATGESTYSIVATHGTCANLSTPTEFTINVEEAGVKIAALGSTALYINNDPTHFIPMYVSNEYLAGVDANSVEKYTWQLSDDGTSEWKDCTRSYSNFNAANNQSNGKVVVTNGSKNCNNWRANQVGYYRCKLTYDNGEVQVSGNIHVTAATNNKTNKQHIGITYNLPIISVNTGATDFPSDCFTSSYPSAHADDLKKKRSVDVMMFNPDGSICYDRKARMNYRGSSSLNFQKKSYAFCPGKEKCGDDEKGADYVKTNKENLFGLSNGAEDKDWVLYAANPDPSMMRNRLVFDLYQKMRNLGVGQDETKEWGVNSMYVELVVNGEYKGVYVLMDKITNNANRVNIKNENGFIVKFDKTDVVDRVENTDGDQKTFATSRTGTKNSSNGIESYGSYIDQRFEIEYPEKEDIELWDAFYGNVQQRFENFETALENKDYATVRTLIDYDSWADWFIITELAKNQDGFRASCIFVYDGDKIEARPLWDQELSFNNGTRVKHGIDDPDGLLITTSSVYSDAFYAPFWFTGNKGTNVTGGLLNDPCFVSLVKQKWATYQSGICSAASIGDMVADYNTELGNAIDREAARWPYTQAVRGNTSCGTGNYSYVGYYSQGEGNPNQYSYTASKAAITAWASDRSTALDANSGLGKAINDLNGEALIFTISPSSVETTPWKQVLLTVNAPEGYEYTFDDSSINNATVRASVKKDNNTYAIKIPRPTAWGIGGNGDPDTQTQYQVSATIEVSGENECGTIQNGTATSTITLTDVTEDCNPEIVKP